MVVVRVVVGLVYGRLVEVTVRVVVLVGLNLKVSNVSGSSGGKWLPRAVDHDSIVIMPAIARSGCHCLRDSAARLGWAGAGIRGDRCDRVHFGHRARHFNVGSSLGQLNDSGGGSNRASDRDIFSGS